MNALTSDDLNYLVYRYLHESGFQHSAFNFGCEASLNKSSIDGNKVPPGALVTLVQKGLQYIEMEANLENIDTDVDFEFTLIQPFELLTLDVPELRQKVEERKRQKAAGENEKQSKEKENEKKKGIVIEDQQKEKKRMDCTDGDQQLKVKFNLEGNVTFGGPEPMDISTSSRPQSFHSSDVLMLEGHRAEVCACAWSPVDLLLASGSGDYTARIWGIADWTNTTSLENRIASVRVLKHAKGTPNEKKNEVLTLDWNLDGTLLATGSYDGRARIWTTNGELSGTLSKHMGPIYTVKWNKKGDYLLTGSRDHTATVWDVKANEMNQQFKLHSGAIIDVDWRTNRSFASCSADTMIYVCKIGDDQPIKMFSGHKAEVNCVKWDPCGVLLASCSDDCTAKIWGSKQDKHIYDLKDHTKEIYTIEWSPTGPATDNPNKQLLLASASLDSTVKLWDMENGRFICSLNGHRDSVISLCFSPNGEYLASGSMDRSMHIWSLKDGEVIRTYSGNGSIFDISWIKRGDKIAVCTNNNLVSVLDFRM